MFTMEDGLGKVKRKKSEEKVKNPPRDGSM
jgi:hypothetical protein